MVGRLDYHVVLGEGAGFVGQYVADAPELLGYSRAADGHPRHLRVPHHQETVHRLTQVQVHYQTDSVHITLEPVSFNHCPERPLITGSHFSK